MTIELSKETLNTILCPATPLVYKNLQQITTTDNEWKIIEHILCHRVPHIFGKEEDL